MTTATSSIVLSTEAPVFHSGLEATSTTAPLYTGTGRPTYSRIVTSDGRVRRSKQGVSIPPRRSMRFTASRMCCPGDENTLRVEQQDTKDDDKYDTPAVTSIGLIYLNADSGMTTLLPSAIDTMEPISLDTTSPMKHSVQKPTKSANQLEKEYLENISALTDRDEADWIKAVTLLEMDRSKDALYQAEQKP
jgi:hypothetical protein